jgi:hypothetical protein
MQKILKTERCGDGVNVVWRKDGKETTGWFSFTRLIDMKVNALDLLEHPGDWGMDEQSGRIVLAV